jgi:hypothetical protein
MNAVAGSTPTLQAFRSAFSAPREPVVISKHVGIVYGRCGGRFTLR